MEDELRVGKKFELKTSIGEADKAEVTITKDGITANGVISADSLVAANPLIYTKIEPGVIRVGHLVPGLGLTRPPHVEEFDLIAKFLELQNKVAELEKKLDALSGGIGPHSRP